jgi:hypothetical protein
MQPRDRIVILAALVSWFRGAMWCAWQRSRKVVPQQAVLCNAGTRLFGAHTICQALDTQPRVISSLRGCASVRGVPFLWDNQGPPRNSQGGT